VTPISRHFYWAIPLLVVATLVVYANGLNGPFLFDDHAHITQNRWVKIESLAWGELWQAWNSSFQAFPSNRPLAQLSFGVNHALSDGTPWAFKATNLAIHLLNGLFVFVLTRLSYRAIAGKAADSQRGTLLAAATTAAWLLHPMHVSTVLYAVQRMAQLSSLGLLAALCCYFWGRISIAEGRLGIPWILAAIPAAVIGFLGKENGVLLPILLLASELTVLSGLSTGGRRGFVRLVWAVYIALPLLAGLAYLATHPGYVNYDGRSFSFAERVLTQPRALWLYLQWLYIPDVTAYGLFHDDIRLSKGIMDPPTTLLAITALVGIVLGALLLRKRYKVFAFAVLFFLAGHAIESSIFPLEPVFEHRNYLPSFGPIFLLAYLVTITSHRFNVHRTAVILGILLVSSYGLATHVRVDNWSSYQSFALSAATNHPDSPRSNFTAAQVLITALPGAGEQTQAIAETARTFLHRGLAADPRCINCLFGLIVLDLHLGQAPEADVIDQLKATLQAGDIAPTKVSTNQFSFLVRWQTSGQSALDRADLEGIFDAALKNKLWTYTARAGIEAAYRKYHELVTGDLHRALRHAQAAVHAWPTQWSYHMQMVRVLQKLGRTEQAMRALDLAASLADNESQKLETAALRSKIATQTDS